MINLKFSQNLLQRRADTPVKQKVKEEVVEEKPMPEMEEGIQTGYFEKKKDKPQGLLFSENM